MIGKSAYLIVGKSMYINEVISVYLTVGESQYLKEAKGGDNLKRNGGENI
jgi:hypothetical protein